jgi:hypothetical protein
MGVARLLAKGWVVFCLFAAALALSRMLSAGTAPLQALSAIGLAAFLFGAMGLLFIGGYGVSGGHRMPQLKPMHLAPGFNEIVFAGFAVLSFFVETVYAPHHASGGILGALETAIRFAVPGQRALEEALGRCHFDGGSIFASAFAWLLALIYFGSAVSRLRLSAALVRLERKRRRDPLGPSGVALVVGTAAVVGIQFLFIGTLFAWLDCGVLGGLPGALLIGLAPLMLAYLVIAALINLLAANPDG